jgi:hypothetical protein
MRLVHLAIVIAVVVGAQTDAHAGNVAITINMVSDGAGGQAPAVAGAPPVLNVGDTITITCPTNCDDLAVVQGVKTLKAKGTTAASPWTSPAIAQDGGTLTIGFGTMSAPATVTGGDPAGDGGGTPGGGDGNTGLLRPECPTGSPKENEIFVDTTGNVLATNLAKFDSDDTLTVWVVGPASTVDAIRVERRSSFRDVTVLRIQGDPSQVTGRGKESGGTACKRVQLADFSPGRGQFALVGADSSTVAEFEFAVRPVFDGMFTVAFIASWLVDRSYSLRVEGTEGTIIEDPTGNVEGRFALMYTAFLPISRLSSSIPESVNRRFGVSAGVVLDDPTKNILFGVNIGPFNGLSLVVGGHFGEIKKLDGVAVGDELPADSEIPTVNDWDLEWFVGGSIDISVATKLFFNGFGI